MKETCEAIQPLLSGYIDEELDAGERARLEAHLAACPACRAELEDMKRLCAAASQFRIEHPPEEVWDTFLEGVYNRRERRFGWALLVLGAAVLAAYGVYVFIVDPWGPALLKLAIAAPVLGLGVLFVSVLRQRLAAAKTDRYSREIMR